MRQLLAFVVAVGCDRGSFDFRPGQQGALQTAWRDVYGMLGDDPPQIEWVPVDELPGGGQGVALEGWGVRIACGSACNVDVRCENTTFAHELLHWRAWLRFGDVDGFHFREKWELVQTAADALVPPIGACDQSL